MPPMPSRVKKLPLTAARKVRIRNRLKLQQRKRRPRRVKSVAREQQR